MNPNSSVGVVGGGAWGTALAVVANRAGSRVILGSRNGNVVRSIRDHRTNEIYLPGVFLDPRIEVRDTFDEVCRCDFVIMAMPSHILRTASIILSDLLSPAAPIVLACKGIERGSLMLMSEVAQSVLPHNPMIVLSGPTFADEAARGLPTALTLAGDRQELLERLSDAIGGKLFRPYVSDDIIGAQVGGAVKNIIAIACGIAVGKNFGENARSALVTRGFTEITRLAAAKGARQETLMGLSCLGDLILTCGSLKSRNTSFGVALGQGKSKDEILAGRGRGATEGVIAAESISKLAHKYGISMPICEGIYRILYEQASVDRVIEELLDRPFRREAL